MSESKVPVSESKEPMNPTLARMMKGGMLVFSQALMPSHPEVAMALVGAAEMAGPGAGGFGEGIQRFGNFVSGKTGRNLEQRLEGRRVDPEPAGYLLSQAAPFVANASTERKRQMMEDILFNGLCQLEDEAKRAEAIEALKLIEEIPDAGVMIFAAFLAKLDRTGLEYVLPGSDHRDSVPDCGLNEVVYMNALGYVYRIDMSIRPKLSCNDFLITYTRHSEQKRIVLTGVGKWLAQWIKNNPSDRSGSIPGG